MKGRRRKPKQNPSRKANGRTLRRVSDRGRAGERRPHTLTLAYSRRRASGEEGNETTLRERTGLCTHSFPLLKPVN
ncbi:hypothetical protein HanXRQr2_Chr15g0704401 [Helianthus annuus]|uniref:Uncharacterized protein n=1 Tax=Helianthus annuus TaxID=4232 RepID=A0A9K3E1V6_HELAN|nr:hypothetical protein HanXRQr2_Chr15g0704401 [Helianthus annuus]KAJ0456759.1 hypothetical protein HanIR_Chr15g0766071 [Helianthus annuus]KAJ0473910.1 hypothetical protein HanHA89_Chr15g0623711 [Helianthus annuus]KAJ0649485.1 hypothetical protein HanLR1_Chr15g0584791 [Helianthus annuus]KAJ0653288.1 hypothetical protein HanOQP8_Chr15g0581821 [Helianthus annuus]